MKTTIIKFLSLGFIFSLTIVSCKKKEVDQQISSVTPITTTSNLYYGFFSLEEYDSWQDGKNNAYYGQANAYNCTMQLYNNPVSDHATWQAVRIGTVSVNGNDLSYNNAVHIFMDTVSVPNYKLQRLITLNSTVLPSFTVTVADTFPKYSSANALQINDTLFLNSNFTIPLNSISYYDKVECIVTHNPLFSSSIISTYKTSNIPVTQFVFTPSDLSVFAPGDQLYCRLILKKYSTQTFNGKNFRFETCSFNDFGMIAQ